jgi:hypothetical protein
MPHEERDIRPERDQERREMSGSDVKIQNKRTISTNIRALPFLFTL